MFKINRLILLSINIYSLVLQDIKGRNFDIDKKYKSVSYCLD